MNQFDPMPLILAFVILLVLLVTWELIGPMVHVWRRKNREARIHHAMQLRAHRTPDPHLSGMRRALDRYEESRSPLALLEAERLAGAWRAEQDMVDPDRTQPNMAIRLSTGVVHRYHDGDLREAAQEHIRGFDVSPSALAAFVNRYEGEIC